MIVKMKKFEKDCIDDCSKFKSWEVKCSAKDSWLAGFRKAVEYFKQHELTQEDSLFISCTEKDFNTEVEIEFKDGSHQLNQNV